MTDRLKGCTVAFENDIREDDAEVLLAAIRQLRGVVSVSPSLSMPADWVAQARVRAELGTQILHIIYPEMKGNDNAGS